MKYFFISDHADVWGAARKYVEGGGWIEECEKSGRCELINYAKLFDGWTVWAAGWYSPVTKPRTKYYPLFLKDAFEVWNKLAKKYNKLLVPSVIPGYIAKQDPPEFHLPRNADMFEEMLKNVLVFSLSVKIDTYNEYRESTNIDPTMEENNCFLKALEKVVLTKISNKT